jgi:YD repeat-containing protein
MPDREQRDLRGLVKSCTEENIHPARTDADGNTYPEVHSEYTTDYDRNGRILATHTSNSDGSQWVVRYEYDASGRRLKTTSGVEGKAPTNTIYSYDQQGRLQNITDDSRPDIPISFHYDEHGRKTKIAISRSADYRPNMALSGSPFEALEMAPNLPGGGSATTIYDEHDRPAEVQVRDANGELVRRALRIYDAHGRVIEEKQILDTPETLIPPEIRAKMLAESGLPENQLVQEIRERLTKLMAGQSGPYAVSYRYDTLGRVTHTSRRIFNVEEEIETVYNEHRDTGSEITRSTRPGAEADSNTPAASISSYSEVRYSYQYDRHENWIERAVSYRSSPHGTFQPSTVTRRTLVYY